MKRSAGPSRLVLVLPALAATLLAAPDAHACPCSLWGPEAVPANLSANDTGAVELGVRFRAATSGTISAHPLLQVGRQRRRARGQPLDEHGRAARHRELRGRDRFRLAAGTARRAHRRRGEHAVRRLVPHAGRALLVRRRVLRSRSRERAARRARQRHRRRERRLYVRRRERVPEQQLQRDELLGGRRVRGRRAGSESAHRRLDHAGRGRRRCQRQRRRARRLLEGDGRDQHRRHHVRAARRRRQRRARHRDLRGRSVSRAASSFVAACLFGHVHGHVDGRPGRRARSRRSAACGRLRLVVRHVRASRG